jgi:3-polyprenyl-4-hydroxybenzoate decarboxylase
MKLGCFTKGYQCVEILIDRKMESYAEQVNYLYKMKDKRESTPFMYACINCPSDTMKKYIERVPKPKEWYEDGAFYIQILQDVLN